MLAGNGAGLFANQTQPRAPCQVPKQRPSQPHTKVLQVQSHLQLYFPLPSFPEACLSLSTQFL